MELSCLKPGHRVRTSEGRQAEVLEESSGGAIRVAYLRTDAHSFGVPFPTGEEDLLGAREVEAMLGVAPPRDWDEEVVIVLHHVPGSDEGPSEYRAETLSGVPNNVKVHGGDPASRKAALDHLLGGLSLLGFHGIARVEDGSGNGFERYEVDVHPIDGAHE